MKKNSPAFSSSGTNPAICECLYFLMQVVTVIIEDCFRNLIYLITIANIEWSLFEPWII